MLFNQCRGTRLKAGILGVGVWLAFSTTQAHAIETDPECTTNIQVVEKREYKTASWVPIDDLPESVPPAMAQIFTQITDMQVNASDDAIAGFFTMAPEVEQLDRTRTRFLWHRKTRDTELHLTLTKLHGCVQQVVLSYRNPASTHKNKMESLIQDNVVPAKVIKVRGKNDKLVCEVTRIEGQSFKYSVNDRPRYGSSKNIPPFALRLLRIYHDNALFGKDSLFYYDKPKKQNRTLIWELVDGNKKKYTVSVDTKDDCDSFLTIQWKGKYGLKNTIDRENRLIIPESY